MHCQNCGKETSGQFCPACGSRLAQGTPSAHATAHFRIHYKPHSFAEQNLRSIETRLENAYAAATDVLAVDLQGAMIDVHLSELVVQYGSLQLGGGGYAVPKRMQIHDIFLPDSPGDSLERSLVVLLLALVLKHDVEPPALLIDGLLAQVMQRLGSFPPDEQIQSALADAKAQGSLPIISSMLDGPKRDTQDVYYSAAAGCVGFLIQTYGIGKVQTFMRQLDSSQPDIASRAAFGHDLFQLNKAWNRSIKLAKPGGILRFIKMSGTYLRAYKFKVAEIVLYICLSVAFTIGMAKLQGFLFDKALAKHDLHALAVIMSILVGAFIIVSITSLRQSYLTAYVSEGVLREMRLKMFALIQRLHPGFFQSTRTGDIMSRMTSDMAAIQNALTGSMAQGFRMVLTLVAAIVTIYVTDWKLATIGLLGTPLFFVSTRYLGPAAARASKERQRKLANSTSTLQENLSAQPVIKSFGLADHVISEYRGALNSVFDASLRLTYLTGIYSLTANSVATSINLAVLGVGAWLVIGGNLTAGILVSFLSLMAQVIGPVQNLSSILQGFQQATGAMDRIDELLQTEPAIQDAPGAQSIPKVTRGIRLENVTFGYSEEQVILRDLTLDIPAGANVALVGPSGCGKSTILNMIMRFYDPEKGCITFDGADIRSATIDSVRGQMGVVFQDNVLFNTSIRENIRLGNLDASDDDVEEAARSAEIHDLIMSLPDEYDTNVGERGNRLSGGQRQRVAIARAIVRNPSILVLDEATSALDSRTEAAINETFHRIGRGRTTVSVTHRLSSVVSADRVFVLDRGRLVEEGTHDELLEQGGLYANLWKEQGGAVSGAGQHPGIEAAHLQNIPMFRQLDPRVLASLAKRLLIERFATGEDIISRGDAADKLYIVQRGQVAVLGSDPVAGSKPLAMLREGDYFGEMALLRDAPRVATVRALTPVQALTLRKEDFKGLLAATPELHAMMEQVMRQRIGGQEALPQPTGISRS